jgi:hypothetical protein
VIAMDRQKPLRYGGMSMDQLRNVIRLLQLRAVMR